MTCELCLFHGEGHAHRLAGCHEAIGGVVGLPGVRVLAASGGEEGLGWLLGEARDLPILVQLLGRTGVAFQTSAPCHNHVINENFTWWCQLLLVSVISV